MSTTVAAGKFRRSPLRDCTAPGCDRPPRSRGLCDSHYIEWSSDGRPDRVTWAPSPRVGRSPVRDGSEVVLDGAKIRRRRNARWLTRADVAAATGVRISAVRNWEERPPGRHPLERAKALADALGTTVEALEVLR